jgi:hypothetical protein
MSLVSFFNGAIDPVATAAEFKLLRGVDVENTHTVLSCPLKGSAICGHSAATNLFCNP